MESRFGMLDTDNDIPSIEKLRVLRVLPYPTFGGTCVFYPTNYTPAFPIMFDESIQGIACGNCITDIIKFLRRRHPNVRIYDNRKNLYN